MQRPRRDRRNGPAAPGQRGHPRAAADCCAVRGTFRSRNVMLSLCVSHWRYV